MSIVNTEAGKGSERAQDPNKGKFQLVDQTLANDGQAQTSPRPDSVNSVLAPSHAYVFTYGLWLLLRCNFGAE